MAIEGGVGGIEHGALLDEPTLRLMAQKGIHLTPTLTMQEASVQDDESENDSIDGWFSVSY